MQAFNFKVPTEIVFGRGAEDKTAEKLAAYNAHRVFIVYGGGSVVKSGLLPKIEAQLQKAGHFHNLKRCREYTQNLIFQPFDFCQHTHTFL